MHLKLSFVKWQPFCLSLNVLRKCTWGCHLYCWTKYEIYSKLTHWGRDKMVSILQTTFSNACFFNENIWILLRISLKFLPEVQIYNIPALVQKIAWHCPGDKPLSEPMMAWSLTHRCITRPQWLNVHRQKYWKKQPPISRSTCSSRSIRWWRWSTILHYNSPGPGYLARLSPSNASQWDSIQVAWLTTQHACQMDKVTTHC